MTIEKHCYDFDCADERFSYEKDGCTPCIHKPDFTFPKLGVPNTEVPIIMTKKCKKGHQVRIKPVRTKKPKKRTEKREYIFSLSLPKKEDINKVKEDIRQILNAEVKHIMTGDRFKNLGLASNDFLELKELEDLGFEKEED